LWTETTDISNNGFYCNTAQPFAPGDTLQCLIALPGQKVAEDSSDQLYLEAKADVVRIVTNSGTGFGIGCQIAEYRVVNRESLPSWALREIQKETPETAKGESA
jgi:hypothetical protein